MRKTKQYDSGKTRSILRGRRGCQHPLGLTVTDGPNHTERHNSNVSSGFSQMGQKFLFFCDEWPASDKLMRNQDAKWSSQDDQVMIHGIIFLLFTHHRWLRYRFLSPARASYKFRVDKVSLMVCLSMKWQATKCGDVRLTQRLSRVPHHSTKWEPIGHAT